MAKASDGSVDSWPGFLSELTKSFLILRDVFGYALPGAVFLSIGVLCRRFSLRDVKYLLDPYQPPAWLAVLVGLGACYAIGHVMAGIAYLFFNHWRNPFKTESTASDFKKSGPSQIPKELIDIRGHHPELLTEFERQATMTQLRGSTGVAMLVGSLLFYRFSTPSLGWVLGLAGLFLLVVFWFSAIPNIQELKLHTIEAAALTDERDKAVETICIANLKQTLEDCVTGYTMANERRRPTDISSETSGLSGICRAASEVGKLLSQLENTHSNDTTTLSKIESLSQTVGTLGAAITKNHSDVLIEIGDLASEAQVKDATTHLENKIDERSTASLRRDRSFLASSYPRLLAIISAELDNAKVLDGLSPQEAEETDANEAVTNGDKQHFGGIRWKADIAVLPLCENEGCKARKRQLDLLRSHRNDKFEYKIKSGSLYIPPELLAAGGMFVLKIGIASLPGVGVVQHWLEIAGINSALVQHVGSVVPGLFPTRVIQRLNQESVKNAADALGDDTVKFIFEQVVATPKDRSKIPHLQREVEACLKQGRMSVLNVGGTAHLELGRLMEMEDREGHVPFGGLVRILPDDGEYLWVCDICQREYNSRPSASASRPASQA